MNKCVNSDSNENCNSAGVYLDVTSLFIMQFHVIKKTLSNIIELICFNVGLSTVDQHAIICHFSVQ